MANTTEHNPLYPVFLKLEQLHMLIIGAGEVGYEKLFFILKSTPKAKITMIATWINPEIRDLLENHPNHRVDIIVKAFEPDDIKPNHDLVIAATNLRELNEAIQKAAKAKGKLINVADTPALCDFYLGSIVTKGWLKIAISTNGKSPTFAKRFRQVLEEVLPNETSALLDNLYIIRDRLQADFSQKVKQLNHLTASLVEKPARKPFWKRFHQFLTPKSKRA